MLLNIYANVNAIEFIVGPRLPRIASYFIPKLKCCPGQRDV